MQTESRQTGGPAGTSTFTWTDAAGTAWTVQVTWSVLGGRVEATALAMDSGGLAPVTSTVVRQVERLVREHRTQRAAEVQRLARAGGETGRRAARQVPAYEAPSRTGPGRPREDDLWRRRAEAMRDAWAERRSMQQALRDLEPGWSDDTYRKRMDRARAWDRETGAGVLDGVGRPRKDKA